MSSQNNALEPNAKNEQNKEKNEDLQKMAKVKQAALEDERIPSKKNVCSN